MLSNPNQSSINPKDKYTDVQVAALRLLGRGDYTLTDITNRLIKKGFDPIEVNQDLDLLVRKKWISDERVAQNIWEYYKGEKGNIFIRQKMQLKQVTTEIIEDFFQNLSHMAIEDKEDPIDYKTLRRKLATRYKITNWIQVDQATKNKIYGYLGRRGFSNIQTIITRISSPHD